MYRKRNRKGFTIVELVIVIAVIAVLATVLVPTFGDVINKANDSKAMQEAKNSYAQYLVDHAASGNAASYFVYEADANRFVAIDNGSIVGAYETKDAALKAMVSDPTEELVDTGDGKLWAYGGEAGNGNNSENVKESLTGKKISFMGDSITTYLNWNNNTSFNTTLGGNAVYYERSGNTGRLSSVHYTWWMRTVENLGLELCVNNSWSGSKVTGKESDASTGCGNTRTSNLHNDITGEKPDIIVIYLGTNDYNHNNAQLGSFTSLADIYDAENKKYTGDLTKFAPAYATMVHKIKSNYPESDLYLCTIDSYTFDTSDDPSAFNAVIKSIAEHFNCSVIDFYSETPISPETINTYTVDDGKEYRLHPNAKGTAEMYECVKNALAENYQITEADDRPIFRRDVIENLQVSNRSGSSLLASSSTGVYMYTDTKQVNQKLSGKTVTRIGVPIIKVADHTKESYFMVYVVDSTAPYTKRGEYKITIPANRFSSNTVNQWAYFDVSIKLEEGQTLAFQTNPSATLGYANDTYTGKAKAVNETGGFQVITMGVGTTKTYPNITILYDIFVK